MFEQPVSPFCPLPRCPNKLADRYGPCEHPGEAPPVAPIDVLRSGTKLDSMNKRDLASIKSFTVPNNV